MDNNSMNSSGTNLMWWAMLVVAVIAVPSVGFAIVSVSGTQGMMQVAVFMLTCWVCTYLGMKLMQSPSISEKLNTKK